MIFGKQVLSITTFFVPHLTHLSHGTGYSCSPGGKGPHPQGSRRRKCVRLGTRRFRTVREYSSSIKFPLVFGGAGPTRFHPRRALERQVGRCIDKISLYLY